MLRFVLFVDRAGQDGTIFREAADYDVIMHRSALPDAIGKAIIELARSVGADGRFLISNLH